MRVARPRLSPRRGGAVLLAAALLAGCGGPSGELRKELNSLIAAGNYAKAEARLGEAKEGAYGKKNLVLYYLDLGAVQHHGGRYKESDDSLDRAERRMDELYTKSVSKAAATLMLNDKTVDYAGERHERSLAGVYRALNYVLRGDRDGALVEVRKLSRLLQEYADVYGPKTTAYKDDAFAQFLASLLYEDDGRADDARIAREKAARARERAAKAYGSPIPKLDALGHGAGELVFVHSNGVAPRKISQSFQIAWNDAVAAVNASRDDEKESARAVNAIQAGLLGKAVTVAFPALVQDPFQVQSSVVEAAGTRVTTELVEDVAAVAKQDLAERVALIRVRAIARATVKFVVAKAAADAAARKYGKASWQAALTKVGGAAFAAATETADTRAWGTLPAQFRAARLRLPPGQHEVRVSYLSSGGAVVTSRVFPGVEIRKGRRTYLHDRTAI